MGRRSTTATTTCRGTARRALARTSVGVLVLLALAISMASLAGAADAGFPDVPADHPHAQAISNLASRGIIAGYANGDFGPGDPVTRRQFAKMIVLAGGYPVSEADICPFTDVQKSDATTFYPDNYIAVAAARQITKGVDAARFSPLRRITRLQVVSMAVRMADDVRPGLLAPPYTGWAPTQVWAADATHGADAARAEHNGLLAGLDLAALNPYGDMTRGEVARVLSNLLGRLEATITTGSSTTTTPSATSTTTSTTTPVATAAMEDLGGVITSAPAACSQGFGLLDVFARSAEGTLIHKAWDGTGWSDWVDLGGVVKPGSDPTAVSWGLGRLDVFVRGADDALWHRWRDGGDWSAWENLGGRLSSSPAAAYREVGVRQKCLDVFAVDADGVLRHRGYDGATWTPWTSGGVRPIALEPGLSPAVVTWGATRLDLAVVKPGGGLWRCYLPPDGEWLQWQSIGGAATSGPSMSTWASWAEGRLDVFVRGQDRGLWHRSVVSGLWTRWENMGVGAIASAPASVSWGGQRIDVFVRGMDDTLRRTWWDGSRWRP